MASAQEIGKVSTASTSFAAEVLVKPPLDFDSTDLRRRLGNVIFCQDVFRDTSAGGLAINLEVQEVARLGGISQIIRLEGFDSTAKNGAMTTCDRAVGALCTYVTAMAEGDAAALSPYIYPRG